MNLSLLISRWVFGWIREYKYLPWKLESSLLNIVKIKWQSLPRVFVIERKEAKERQRLRICCVRRVGKIAFKSRKNYSFEPIILKNHNPLSCNLYHLKKHANILSRSMINCSFLLVSLFISIMLRKILNIFTRHTYVSRWILPQHSTNAPYKQHNRNLI